MNRSIGWGVWEGAWSFHDFSGWTTFQEPPWVLLSRSCPVPCPLGVLWRCHGVGVIEAWATVELWLTDRFHPMPVDWAEKLSKSSLCSIPLFMIWISPLEWRVYDTLPGAGLTVSLWPGPRQKGSEIIPFYAWHLGRETLVSMAWLEGQGYSPGTVEENPKIRINNS
jgi:hypothetical protein